MSKPHNMVLGALTGDAASLGLHWIYDQPRIAELGGQTPEFRATTAQDFDGVPSYFAHPLKRPGDLTQYGEQVMVLLRALAASGGAYDQTAFNAAFTAHFGYGGTYVGYIDHATRGTLDNLAGGDASHPNGARDTQLPAVSRLPALIAAGQETHADAAIRSTNDTETALSWGRVATAMLLAARDDGSTDAVTTAALAAADATIRPALDAACAAKDQPSVAFIAETGMACELSYGIPGALHILQNSTGYQDALRTNILAGGDSCGRAILLGGILGAIHGVPEAWLEQLTCRAEAQSLLDQIC